MDLKLTCESVPFFKKKLSELAPWMHQYKIDESTFTGLYPVSSNLGVNNTWCNDNSPPELIERLRSSYSKSDHDKISLFIRNVVDSLDVEVPNSTALDIASGGGRTSILLAESGFRKVISSEIRTHQSDQLRVILDCLADRTIADKVDPRNDLVSADDPDYPNHFSDYDIDAVFSLGLLYHLANPLQHIENCRRLTNKYVVVYTKTLITSAPEDFWIAKTEDPGVMTKATQGISWIPHYQYIPSNYKKLGFSRCKTIYPDPFVSNFRYFDNWSRKTRLRIRALDMIARKTGIRLGYTKNYLEKYKWYDGINHNFFCYILEK